MSNDRLTKTLQKDADQCVKCAVCLPHCPTYALSPEEAESPRGRITLLQGIVHGQLEPTADVHKHLSSCLNCGRCEQVCPANVPYTRLLDGTRSLMAQSSSNSVLPSNRRHKMAAWLLSSPRALSILARFGRIAKRCGFNTRFPNTRMARWLNWLPPATSKVARQTTTAVSTTNINQSTAWLFAGCLTTAFEKEVAVATIRVAAAAGIELKPLPKNLCCGALYQHAGNDNKSSALIARTLEAASQDDKPVVVIPSGCARGLEDGLTLSNLPSAHAFRSRITSLFPLLENSWHDKTKNQLPLSAEGSTERIGIYAPCSLANDDTNALFNVVQKINNKKTIELGRGLGCCGAAGDHMVLRPERADTLAKPIVEEIMLHRLTHVLVPNIGCAWHLRATLAASGSTAIVEHPVCWLERQLATLGPKEAVENADAH